MASVAEEQAATLQPPRRGAVWSLTVDSTARAYDISKLLLGAFTPSARNRARANVVLYLQAETADVYFYFDSAVGTSLSDTAKQSATAADAAFADTYCARLAAGTSEVFRIDRALDKFIQVKAASTSGILRMWAYSENR